MGKIGYVVKDILDKVHTAINNTLVLEVKFQWVKYIATGRVLVPDTSTELQSPRVVSGKAMLYIQEYSVKNLRTSSFDVSLLPLC